MRAGRTPAWGGDPDPRERFRENRAGQARLAVHAAQREGNARPDHQLRSPRRGALGSRCGQRASRRGVGIRDDRRLPGCGRSVQRPDRGTLRKPDRRRALRARRPRVPLDGQRRGESSARRQQRVRGQGVGCAAFRERSRRTGRRDRATSRRTARRDIRERFRSR